MIRNLTITKFRFIIELSQKYLQTLQISYHSEKNCGIGSDTDLSPKVFSELKKLFESFQKQARINNIPETVTAGIKAYTILNDNNINNSKISDPRVKSLKKFLKKLMSFY